MYHCDFCGAQTKKGQKLLKTITYREKTYRNNRTSVETKRLTRGTEIEKEYKLCPQCDARANEPTIVSIPNDTSDKLSPAEIAAFAEEVNRIVKEERNAATHS